MESWDSFLRRNLGEPVPFNEKWEFLSRPLNPKTDRYIPYRWSCKQYKTWFVKNGFYIATDHETIRNRLFMVRYGDVGIEIFSGRRVGSPLVEIRQLFEAISDPVLFPCCVGMSWAGDLVEAVLKEM